MGSSRCFLGRMTMDSIRMEDLRTPIIGLAGVLLGALIAAIVQLSISSREYDAKMVEIAMGVLRAPPSKDNKDLLGVRTWALRVVERHSGTPFESEAERNAVKNNTVPYVTYSRSWSY
jgi:hypothetical protein